MRENEKKFLWQRERQGRGIRGRSLRESLDRKETKN
jgi:hypothetical protein